MLQKISGILAGSSRVTSVDVNKEAGTVRPGAPTFGRPVGASNLAKNSIVRSAHQAIQKHNEIWDKRTKEQEQAATVQRLADNFFKNKSQLVRERDLVNDILLDDVQEAQVVPTVEIPEVNLSEPKVMKEKSHAEMTEQELDAPDIGRYLDVVA